MIELSSKQPIRATAFEIRPKAFHDPVCGMNVNPGSAFSCMEIGRRKYYFCSERCQLKFWIDPKRYLNRYR